MKYFKRFNYIAYFILYLLLLSFILTLFNITIGFNSKVNEILSLVSICIYILIFGIKRTNKVNGNYLLNGLKFGAIHVLLLLVLSLLFCGFKISLQQLLYYGILLSMMILGTMIGIKLKKE